MSDLSLISSQIRDLIKQMIKKCFETHLSLLHFVQQFLGGGGSGASNTFSPNKQVREIVNSDKTFLLKQTNKESHIGWEKNEVTGLCKSPRILTIAILIILLHMLYSLDWIFWVGFMQFIGNWSRFVCIIYFHVEFLNLYACSNKEAEKMTSHFGWSYPSSNGNLMGTWEAQCCREARGKCFVQPVGVCWGSSVEILSCG